jgi:hypothetical protein
MTVSSSDFPVGWGDRVICYHGFKKIEIGKKYMHQMLSAATVSMKTVIPLA